MHGMDTTVLTANIVKTCLWKDSQPAAVDMKTVQDAWNGFHGVTEQHKANLQ
jgi:hypothetical protein